LSLKDFSVTANALGLCITLCFWPFTTVAAHIFINVLSHWPSLIWCRWSVHLERAGSTIAFGATLKAHMFEATALGNFLGAAYKYILTYLLTFSQCFPCICCS